MCIMSKTWQTVCITTNSTNTKREIKALFALAVYQCWFIWIIQYKRWSKKRCKGKAYGLIFNCCVSRAVYIYIAADYSTDGFLMPFRWFVSLQDYPDKVISDCGTQLMAASKELKDIKGLKQEQMKEYDAEMGMKWHFTTPGGPWRNGCSESLIKSVKRAISCAIGKKVLTFSKLQLCFEAATLVNERPICHHPTNPEDGAYLSPNHLLLRRATSRVPAGPFMEPVNLKQQFRFVQQLVYTFWRHWTREFLPSLLIHQKWHTVYQNVKVGDIGLVQDSNQIWGNRKLAKLSKVFPGTDGLVRHVEIQYKNLSSNEPLRVYNEKSYMETERPVSV